MHIENNELSNIFVKEISNEYEPTGPAYKSQSTTEELVSKLIISEATVRLLKEQIKVLEWENHVWNSSDEHKVSTHFIR